MQAVLCRTLSLLPVRLPRVTHVLGSQATGEIIDEAGDVVIERAARKTRAGRERRIFPDRRSPAMQHLLAPALQVGGQGVQLLQGCG